MGLRRKSPRWCPTPKGMLAKERGRSPYRESKDAGGAPRVRFLFGKGATDYEGLPFSPSSPRPLLLSQSSYFWPLGMVAQNTLSYTTVSSTFCAFGRTSSNLSAGAATSTTTAVLG